jgi:hypothetical protein
MTEEDFDDVRKINDMIDCWYRYPPVFYICDKKTFEIYRKWLHDAFDPASTYPEKADFVEMSFPNCWNGIRLYPVSVKTRFIRAIRVGDFNASEE